MLLARRGARKCGVDPVRSYRVPVGSAGRSPRSIPVDGRRNAKGHRSDQNWKLHTCCKQTVQESQVLLSASAAKTRLKGTAALHPRRGGLGGPARRLQGNGGGASYRLPGPPTALIFNINFEWLILFLISTRNCIILKPIGTLMEDYEGINNGCFVQK